ncbi:bi-domain-containing oxidoreductase [Fusobacterium perfoetens]|uniref:bi-domain-containing oxidoreductase n=1 Tax=Fusobacterium perfoetens TaxID=852 RepID=UPI0004852694|nr:bi-domain-containing oxidoreductase [Fusobacterium perfoetens]
MKQLFLMVNDGSVKLIETPMPRVKDEHVLIETLYSAVSAGTERSLTSFGGKNLLQKALERPDQVKKVLDKMATDGVITGLEAAFGKLKEPMPMGYSAVGKILECGRGVTEFKKGDLVALVGQAYHSEINRTNKNLVIKLPNNLENYQDAALGALGGIALEGIHQAKVESGETVAVIGLGLLGHITARILNAYGCDVIGYDIVNKELENTKLKAFIQSDDENAEDKTKALTKGRGVDKVIITASTNSNAPMDLAATITRDRAIICMIGVTKMEIDRRPYYEKELTFTIARSYGPGRYDSNYEEKGIDYPIGYVRFTEGRNIEEFIRLLASKKVIISDLITHIIDFEEAEKAYEIITTNKNKEKYIGILLKYKENEKKYMNIIYSQKENKIEKDRITVGLIGAGNFSKTTLIPIMKKTELYNFKGLATTGGVNAAQAKNIVPFEYITNNYKELLADKEIDLIIISTGHNTHAKFIIEALNAGKNVYCEKPLCLTLEELEEIKETYKNSNKELFCGLNRRYAPLIEKIKKEGNTNETSAIYEYTVNAGYIPEDHWVQDEKIGGGRILGEACHFVDTIQYLDGTELEELKINFLQNEAYPKKDNCIISLKFKSGAIGNIIYTSMGSKRYLKEQLRVFINGTIYEMDNYIKLIRYGSIKKVNLKLKQDKGIENEYKYIFNILKKNKKNIHIEESFKAMELLIKGMIK